MSNENKSDSKIVKNEKCAVNKRTYSNTIRITVSLNEPDEESCSVFNYLSLIAEEVSYVEKYCYSKSITLISLL